MNSGDEARARASEQVLGGPDLGDASPVQGGNPVRNHHRLALVVSHIQGRDAERLAKTADRETHFFSEICVKITERLVEQEDLRLDDEGPRHGDPLLLATGQLTGIARHAGLETQTVRDVLGDRHVGQSA